MTEYRGQRSDGYVIVDNGGLFLSEEYGGATRSVRKRYRSTIGSWKVESGRSWSLLNEQDEGTEVCQANVTEAIRRRMVYEAYLWLKEKNPQYLNVEWDEDNANTMRRHGRQALARLVATRLAAEEEAGDLGRHELVAVESRAI